MRIYPREAIIKRLARMTLFDLQALAILAAVFLVLAISASSIVILNVIGIFGDGPKAGLGFSLVVFILFFPLSIMLSILFIKKAGLFYSKMKE